MATKISVFMLGIFVMALSACGMFSYEVENLDPVTEPGNNYLYSNTNGGWTSGFSNGEQILPDGNTVQVEAVLAPVQKQSLEIKEGYSFAMSIEGVVVQ